MYYADDSQGQIALWWLTCVVNDMFPISLFNILPLKKSYHLLPASLYAEHFIYMISLHLYNDGKLVSWVLFRGSGKGLGEVSSSPEAT